MRDDELDGLIFVGLQIRLQKLQLLRRKAVRPAIVQDRKCNCAGETVLEAVGCDGCAAYF